ncbi:MAG: methyl-accepting chemotaxis protein [Deltaproteobacteria bacterium]|nr:methyl-accepting chemotaxis protein [Deltaproteobacteria bacterium]
MTKNLSIKAKILLSVSFFVIVLMSISVIISSKISFNVIFERITKKEAPASVNYIAEKFDKKMKNSLGIAHLVADNPFLIDWIGKGEPDEGKELAISFFKEAKKNDLDFVFLISAKSNRYYTSKGYFKTVSPDNPRDGWFYGTLKSGKKLDININIAEDSKQVMAYINILVGSVENPVGVAGAGLNLTSLSKQLRTTKLSKNSIAYLISKDGGIYAHPEEKYTSEIKNIKNIKDNDFQRIITPAILNDNEGTRSYTDSSGIEKIVVFQTIKSSNWKIIFEIPKNELGKGLGKIQAINMAITIISVALLVITLTLLLNKILKPIKETVAALEDISKGEGDLTKRINVTSNDEIGALGKAFNTFQDKLGNIIRDASDYSSKVDGASDEMLEITRTVSKETNTISTRTDTIAKSTEDVNHRMDSVASAIEESNANISMIASAVEEMSTTILEISQTSSNARTISENAVSVSEQTSVQMVKLGESAIEIGNVTDTITDISEQTNLLALNATIEAARAGEAGKGFAVVASEIKELASQTTIAAQDINSMISSIQDSTKNSVDKIKEITKVINDCNNLISSIAVAIEEQTATTSEISGNISQLSQVVEEVSANVNNSASDINTVTSEIDATNQSVSELANSGSEMTFNAEQVAELAAKLKELMSIFKV